MVELRATHGSWVFLTDTEAWKVKRPVNFGFLDFSTPEQRLHFCSEEIRVNAALAPEVYLGVVPIVRGPRGHSFVGSGAAVDWAVRMRRLPEADSALALLRAGVLGPDALEGLAVRLAAYFAVANPATAEGGFDVLARNVEQNFDGVRPFVGSLVTAALFDEVSAYQRGFLQQNVASLRAREADGRVREGHGDLRLEHVYFPGGRPDATPIVIDAIEFNRGFRCADQALDVAFLAMELYAHNRGDLAEWFLSAFAREANDYDFYPLADFYMSYRAWVRAKIACVVAADPSTSGDKAARKAGEAWSLFELARRFARGRATRPVVVAVGGLPGSGKSTVADEVGRRGIAVISSDRTRKHLGGVAAMARAPESLYREPFAQRTQDEMLRRARLVLSTQRSVILDATFRDAATRSSVRALAGARGAGFLFVETTCAEPTLRRRVEARAAGASISDADMNVYEALKATYEQPAAEMAATEFLIADTTTSTNAAVEAVVARIKELDGDHARPSPAQESDESLSRNSGMVH